MRKNAEKSVLRPKKRVMQDGDTEKERKFMLSDIEIAQRAEMYPIGKVAAELSIEEEDIEYYGHYKAKLSEQLFKKLDSKPDGKLILVTAINPTPAGEGKTTVSVGLADALHQIGKKAVLALREPSLGPVFGIKGGAAGGGYAQVVPMEDINLHFTGDMHAITAANNLLCAMLDNHMQQGNVLRIDQRRVMLKRVLDMNDRALRNIVIGLGGKVDGIPRSDGFQITVASEVMAILCLASDLADLKERLGKILVAYDLDGNPVYAKDLGANGAMTALLKDALKPNLVQTLEHTPALIHGGPFANIAHGCNSLRATKLALKLGDYCVTEAGFGSDLGAEKFFDIKCRYGGLNPSCVVLVATVRALKYNGGVPKTELTTENLDALKKGIVNLQVHIENMKKYGVQVIGCPKTIDGDLKNDQIETSFGFDTACKTYAELIGNIQRDCNSARKYWHFIKLMGRSASHIALECALQTQPNICLVSEEVEAKEMSLDDVVTYIAQAVADRAADGNNFGTVLIPEGLIEFIPAIKKLIAELNEVLTDPATGESREFANAEEQIAFVKSSIAKENLAVLESLPADVARQLCLDRDPHGNVQVSLIETEKLLTRMVATKLDAWKAEGKFCGKFSAQHHFFGYEGRCAAPSNYDADYCYSLGFNASRLISNGKTGYMSIIQNTTAPAEQWIAGGVPITMMMNIERRNGANKPVIRKALVELDGAPFKFFAAHREEWAKNTCYVYPGPIQYWGPTEVCDQTTKTLKLEQAK